MRQQSAPNKSGLRSLLFNVLFLSLLIIQSFSASAEQRSELSFSTLQHSLILSRWVDMKSFSRPMSGTEPSEHFEGRLVFSSSLDLDKNIDSASELPDDSDRRGFVVLRDDSKSTESATLKIHELPPFDFEFVQDGEYLIPVKRGAIPSQHPYWEFILEPGRVWQESTDEGFSRASLPFSLQQRNANCTHNGMLTFLFKSSGEVSRVAFQVASETCLYLKFDLRGIIEASYSPYNVVGAASIRGNYQKEVDGRMPVKSIEQLENDYPGIDTRQFSNSKSDDSKHVSIYGFVVDGTNYVGGCDTRHGKYPYCEVLDVPSFSTAKSIIAGLALMRMEKWYPGTKKLLISDYVPECRSKVDGNHNGHWKNVTFENALDMVTGNYTSLKEMADEDSLAMGSGFFVPGSHAKKIDFSCHFHPRRSDPGATWVYHTSDTYVLGTALNNAFKEKRGSHVDLYTDLIWPLLEPLKLSPSVKTVRRTYDSIAQPFTGYGMTYHRDDIAKIGAYINQLQASDQLDKSLLEGALQRNRNDSGYAAAKSGLRYNNGFWAYNIQKTLGCKEEQWLPLMSGFGGISVVLMPNDTIYYHFSDDNKFSWRNAAKESHKLRPYCE